MIGEIIPYVGSTPPENFLVCDGSAVSRSLYSDLFSVIGTTYGIGDGSTTFNLPNLSGNVALGTSSSHVIGTVGGQASVYLIGSEIPSHTHEVPSHTHQNTILATTPSLAHSVTQQASFTYTQLNGTTNYRGADNVQQRYNSITSAAMTRATNFAVDDHPATACTMSGGVTDCPAFDTEATGSGDAHNNMMPYIALVYLIQAEPDTPPGPVIPSMVLFNGAMPVGPSGAYIAGRR